MSAVLAMKSDNGNRIDRAPPSGIAHLNVEGFAGHDVDPSGELLRTISEVLDIRDIFPRVSEIANHVLPHDCLELFCHDRDDRVRLQARSTKEFRGYCEVALAGPDEFCIVGDLRTAQLWHAGRAQRDFIEHIVAAGYRSFLNVRSVARQHVIRLGFFSKRSEAYGPEDVPTARRIADYIAVAVSHGQLAEQERERTEARVRAEQLEIRARTLAATLEFKRDHGHRRAVGESAAWRKVLTRAAQVASTDTTVFLQGESGSGKEVLARFVHRASPRKGGPFIAINCAALPEQLLESELFGYERGAFTGAVQSKAGQIELASTGVLFLDEVSEMSLTAQAKLLRFLQEREFHRLGGTRLVKANVRVIAASNCDLRQAVKQGRFREDLYYRLQVFDIRLPPLRERTSDIPLLAEAFLHDLCRSLERVPVRLTQEATEMLLAHAWPGNVRELHNALERAAILCENGLIGPEHLSLYSEARTEPLTDLGAVERRTIEQVMRETDWNKAKAARRLGITRMQLYARLRKYHLEPAAASSIGETP